MPVPLLKLDRVAKSFGAVQALKGVSFDLHRGEVHALLGENGAGKSTLIKIITGAHAPDSGTIEIGGQHIAHLTPASAHRIGIACIYQQPALFPHLTVAENIALRLERTSPFSRVRWSERRQRAEQLLKRIGAEIYREATVDSLSMPEQQLVEIACAVGAGTPIVIMDEPTASLTQKEQRLLFNLVRELRSNGVGVIYISHRLEEIFALADRVTVLRDGESVGTRRFHSTDTLQQTPAAQTSPGSADAVSALTETELIKLMVGRDVSHIYPPSEAKPGNTVLSLRNLCCRRSGLRNVFLDVGAGEIVGLAGLVGAGRTELARVVFGLTPADAGDICIDGRRVEIRSPQDAIAHGIAYVPEDRRRHGVILDLPVAHNISMAVHRRLFPGGWLRFGAERRLAREYIRDLGVRTWGPEAPGNTLSGGNQQKVSLARWLATEPKILILDEPTQGVDIGAKIEIHKIIRRLAASRMAVILISSDLPEVVGMSDRIAVMRGGIIVSELPGGSDAHRVMAIALGQKEGLPA